MGVLRKQSSLSFTGITLVFMSRCVIVNSSRVTVENVGTKLPLESRALISFGAPKITVEIQNLLPNNEPLKIHCWSDDDDLGVHVLGFGDSFHWRFHVNFFFATKFQCTTIWRDGLMTFDIFKAKRDSDFRCPTYCLWVPNATAVNGFREHGTWLISRSLGLPIR